MKISRIFIMLLSFSLISIISINIYVDSYGIDICEDQNQQTALVLGARVLSNGQMSTVFKDRVITAINLYHDKKVKKILISGDHGGKYYDEVNAAKKYLLENNIDPEDIFLDHAGFDTYDSIYRAKNIFNVNSIVIITQDFHLPRALYIANKLGIDSCGVSADLNKYVRAKEMKRREFLARVKAYFDIVFNSKPAHMGDKIDITGDGQQTWDQLY